MFQTRIQHRLAFFLLACIAFVIRLPNLPICAQDRPNVLFIAVDDMRCDLGCYGADYVHSPNIDRLAESGVLFERAYCQQALCNPSRASLMTGLRPDSTRVWDLVTDFRTKIPDAVTIPQHFRQHGYQAVAFGKIFHNTFPDDVSWDEPTHRAKDVIAYSEENQRRLSEYREKMKRDGKTEAAINRMRGPIFEIQDQPEEKNYDGKQTLDAIARMKEMADGDRPFFLAIGFIRPHLPWITPKKYWDLYDPAKIPLATNGFFPKNAPMIAYGDRSLGGFYELRGYVDYAEVPTPFESDLTEAQQRELKHAYYASVSFVDAQVGYLINALDELNLADDTIVILWSDHGWKLGEHRSWCKQTNYEIDTRAPMIIRIPGAKANGKKTDALVEFIDIYPTLCEAVGIPIPQNVEGISLVPLVQETTSKVKDVAISQFDRVHEGVRYMGYAMRTDRYRYIEWLHATTGEIAATELYDHANDSDENINIAADQEQLATVDQLSKQLWETLPRPSFPLETVTQSRAPAPASRVKTELVWNTEIEGDLPDSRPAGTYWQVTFINRQTSPVELIWMSPAGERKSMGTLEKDAEKNFRVRPGAVWLVEDAEHRRLGYFVTVDNDATATILP